MRPEVEARRSTLIVASIVWGAFGTLCAASALWGMRTHGHSPVRVTGYELAVWLAWAPLTLVVIAHARRWPILPVRARSLAQHVGLAIGLGVVHYAWWNSMQVALRPFDAMGPSEWWPAFEKNLRDQLFLEGAVYFAVLGTSLAVEYQRKLRDRELRAAQLEASLAQAKLTALELQLQPHFLFNTLHAIGGLVRTARGAEAVEMIAGLSELLRYALDHAGKPLVALEAELAITERYLAIQRVRFPDRLSYTVDVAEEARAALVPALMLQPLVENAVRHGIEPAVEAGRIEITARMVGEHLKLEVFNTGALGAAETGIGIANTRARLEQLFGTKATFALRAERGGVVAQVSIG